MPSDKLQQINVDFHIELADISPKDASMLCEYISDFLIKNYNVVDYSFKIMQDGLKNPNIKVSMYKKKRLTAYNQEYK